MPERWWRIAMHAAIAAAFFFVLQYFALAQSLQTSLAWLALMGLGAGALAYRQTAR